MTIVLEMIDDRIVSHNSHKKLVYICINRLPFTKERFANFICFGRGDRREYNLFLCINDIIL